MILTSNILNILAAAKKSRLVLYILIAIMMYKGFYTPEYINDK